jgi:hypothetical protein
MGVISTTKIRVWEVSRGMVITADNIKQIYSQRESLTEQFESAPELKIIVKDVISVLKKHKCSFGTAKEALTATSLFLDNTMVCRLITPDSESATKSESAVDSG